MRLPAPTFVSPPVQVRGVPKVTLLPLVSKLGVVSVCKRREMSVVLPVAQRRPPPLRMMFFVGPPMLDSGASAGPKLWRPVNSMNPPRMSKPDVDGPYSLAATIFRMPGPALITLPVPKLNRPFMSAFPPVVSTVVLLMMNRSSPKVRNPPVRTRMVEPGKPTKEPPYPAAKYCPLIPALPPVSATVMVVLAREICSTPKSLPSGVGAMLSVPPMFSAPPSIVRVTLWPFCPSTKSPPVVTVVPVRVA